MAESREREEAKKGSEVIMEETKFVLDNEKESLIYHYTSMDALRGILKENELCFWGTRYDSMNDPTEHIYAKKHLMPELLNCFDHDEIKETEIYPYVVSFSQGNDDFIMWRMYKAEVALILDYNVINKWVENFNCKGGPKVYYFGECKYIEKTEELIEEFKQLKRWNIDRGDESTDEITALELTTFIKRMEFKNEKEVRLFTCDYNLPSFRYNAENPEEPIIENKERASDIKIKNVRNRDFVLYKEFHLPKDAFKGIIVNCEEGCQFDRIKRHILAWLYQLKYNIDENNIRHTKTGNLIINF